MPPRRLLAVTLIALLGLAAESRAQVPTIKATLIAQGFVHPIAFVQDPSHPARQVVVEQGGRIRLLINGVVQPTDFLDLSGVVTPTGPDERGLLGFAFAPDYATSGRVYASFTNTSSDSVIARFTRSTGNPLTIDPGTRFDLVWPGGLAYVDQPFANHNGGNIIFGPDGYLYVGFGDGGSGNDPDHRAQNPATLLGKMLRLNVNVPGSDPEGYDVPANNPYVGQPGVLPEIWAFGLRNPWRWSFDNPNLGGSGGLIIGDVGQVTWEEIDWQPAGVGGLNYGWRNREGAHNNVTTLPPFSTPLRDPILEYGRTEGRSVTGGYVYRGSALGAAFVGRYLFGDFATGRIWSLALAFAGGEVTGSNLVNHTGTLGVSGQWSSFGEDSTGELYALSWADGRLYRFDPATPEGTNFVTNGQFTLGDPPSGWQVFATPTSAYIQWNLQAGVFRFYRVPPPSGTNQAVVFQPTNTPFPANAPIQASFQLGNSDGVRKRISVLIHDADFSDLFVCTFWLPANAPLATYGMRTHTTHGWSNATISFYAATANAPGNTSGFYLVDNVSLEYAPALPANVTGCQDANAPSPPGGAEGPELLSNGDFSSGFSSWNLFGQITGQFSGGVFEFIKLPGSPAGVILQSTGQPMTANQIITARFQLGNSSSVRKRVTAILHDADFSDLSACTFWIAPGQPLGDYAIVTFATKAWTNATVAFYPSTDGTDQWIRMDNVSLKRTPSAAPGGTTCSEPGAGADQQAPGWSSGWSRTPTGGVTAGAGAGTSDAATSTSSEQRRVIDALYTWVRDGFERDDDAPLDARPAWVARAANGRAHTLTRTAAFDPSTLPEPLVVFQSWLTSHSARARVQVSVDGTSWDTTTIVLPSDTWVPVTIDLTPYAGQRIRVRLVLDAPEQDETPPAEWRVQEPTLNRP